MTVRWLVPLVLACAMCAFARPRTSRDWAKLTDKDWEKIEEEWETPEEKEEYEFKPPQKQGVDMEKLQQAMKNKNKKGKKGKKAAKEVEVCT
jgi:hypothetical protein